MADPLQGVDLLLAGLGQLLTVLLQLALPVEQLAVALLEHVRPLVQLLVALQEATFQTRQLAALGPRLVVCLALEAHLLVLGLKDQLLLLGTGLRHDATGLLLTLLDGLAAPHPARDEAEPEPRGEREERRDRGQQRIHGHPPVRPLPAVRRIHIST